MTGKLVEQVQCVRQNVRLQLGHQSSVSSVGDAQTGRKCTQNRAVVLHESATPPLALETAGPLAAGP